jgi:hypothetical protein
MPKRKAPSKKGGWSKKKSPKWTKKPQYKSRAKPKRKSAKRGVARGAYKRIRGRGSYTTGGKIPFKRPGAKMATFSKTGHGMCRFQHSEMLEDCISGTTNSPFFSEGGWLLNIANSDTFPWGSLVARNFQEYEFKSLVFEFRSTSGNALSSANTALGVIVGSTQYNVTKADFQSKYEMDNYEFTVSGPPSRSLMFPVECKPSMNVMGRLFCDSALVVPTTGQLDPRFSWLGKFQLALCGIQQLNLNAGELWVHYDVCLYKPSTSPIIQPQFNYYHGEACSNSGTTGGADPFLTGVSASRPFGTQVACSWPSSGGTTVSALHGSIGDQSVSSFQWASWFRNSLTQVNVGISGNNTTIYDPQMLIGSYFIVLWTYLWTGSVTSPTMTIASVSSCLSVAMIGAGMGPASLNGVNPASIVGTTQVTAWRAFKVTGTNPTFSCIPGADPSSLLGNASLTIIAWPGNTFLGDAMPPIVEAMVASRLASGAPQKISAQPLLAETFPLSKQVSFEAKDQKYPAVDDNEVAMEEVAAQAYEDGIRAATRRFVKARRSRGDRADRKGGNESESEVEDWHMSESEPDEQELEELNLRQKRARQMQIGPKVSNLMAGLGLSSTPAPSRSPSRDRGDGKEEKKKT